MRRKLKQISNLSAHGRRRRRAERKTGRQRGASPGVSYEQKRGGWKERKSTTTTTTTTTKETFVPGSCLNYELR